MSDTLAEQGVIVDYCNPNSLSHTRHVSRPKYRANDVPAVLRPFSPSPWPL